MRLLKSILNLTSSLRRTLHDITEDQILIQAVMEANIPKFLEHDLPIFHNIIKDLFPNIEIKKNDLSRLIEHIQKNMTEDKL
jgi:dynein heavy chain